MQDLVNMVDRLEQTNLNPIFCPAWLLLNVALCVIMGKHNISQQGVFLEDFHSHTLYLLWEEVSIEYLIAV